MKRTKQLSLFFLLSSFFLVLAMTMKAQDNTKTETMGKKNLGSLLALYPKPMTVVGAEVNGKVNWLVVGHTGIIGHDRIMVSLSKSHYTNQGIKKTKKLTYGSICVVEHVASRLNTGGYGGSKF